LKRRLLLVLGLAVSGALFSNSVGAGETRLKLRKPGASQPSLIQSLSVAADSVLRHPGRVPFRDFLIPVGADISGFKGPRGLAVTTPRGVFAATDASLPAVQETFRVLAIRVDFLTDSGGAVTTGDGKFDLRSADEVEAPVSLVDSPPHNRDYFLSHLQSLANYYEAQSHGQLVLEYDVYPPEQDSAYHLDDTMDYGPWTLSQDSLIVRYARDVFIDSIELADSVSDIDFSSYDAYIVFHAGPDFQSDIAGDTPRDIPSYTIPLFEDSVAVNDGSHYVHLGMVLPETTTQDNFLGALNGVFAHEFGHILGLPDLYDIDNFYPVVGDYSLMDNGGVLQGILEDPATRDLYAVYGLLPSSMDIWSKAVLWPEAIELRAVDEELDVILETSQRSPEGLIISLNAEEYFLVENRQVDLNGDSTVVLVADPVTGVVLGPELDEYDFLLPGWGGILIWHIDESAIFGRNIGPYFGVNSNRHRRGISLEEADGIIDIGNLFSIHFTGSPEEPFYVGNNVLFSTDTSPSSNSNSGGYSHVTIEVLDEPKNKMQVIARREWGRAGWPVWLDAPVTEGAAWAGLRDAGDITFAFVTSDSVLYITKPNKDWENVGVKLPAAPIPGISGLPNTVTGPDPVFLSVPGAGVLAVQTDGTAPSGWDSDVTDVCTAPSLVSPSSVIEIFVGLTDGSVALLDNAGSTKWTAGGGGGPVISPVVVEDLDGDGAVEFAFVTQHGSVWVLESDGSVKPGWPVQWRSGVVWMTAADFDREEDPPVMELLLADSTGTVEVLESDGSVKHSWSDRGVRISGGRPAIADVDADGFLECAFVSEDGNLYLMNHSANVVTNWPYPLDGGSAADSIAWVSSPVLADVDDDGVPEVLVGSLTGDLVALESDATMCDGWPFSFGLPVKGTPLVHDIAGDGHMSVIVGGDDAVVHSLFLPAVLSGEGDAPWPRYGRSATMANAFPGALLKEPVLPEELMPPSTAYVYPSPVIGDRAYVRYTLAEDAEVVATVIDIKGQQVAVLRQAGTALENEMVWNTAEVGSGLYLVRLVAVSPGGRAQAKTIKVAVAR
jgi:M6 family metalloprotease-like protein